MFSRGPPRSQQGLRDSEETVNVTAPGQYGSFREHRADQDRNESGDRGCGISEKRRR